MDGWITIGTRLDTKQFDKEIASLESTIKAKEGQLKYAKTTGRGDTEGYQKLTQEINEAKARLQELKAAQESYNQSVVNISDRQIGKEISTAEVTEFTAQMDNLAYKILQNEAYLKAFGKFIPVEKVNEINAQTEKWRNELARVKEQQNQVNTSMNSTNNSAVGVGNSVQNVIRKVAKLALGVLGIRSAFMLVRRASSTLAQYNEQYAANLEYFRYALAQALAPVLEYIVGLAFKLLNIINYLANAWFGVNLFSNASAKAFQKASNHSKGMSKNLKNSAKSAKEISKEIAGFDEMNVLQDNRNKSGADNASVGGGGGVAPGFDLSKITKQPVPEWIKKIKDFGLWVKDHWKGIVALLLTIGTVFLLFKLFGNKGSSPISGTTGLLKSFGKALESIAILGGVALVLKEIAELFKAFAETGLSVFEASLLIVAALGSITLAFTAMSAATKLMDWQGIAGAVVILGGMALVLNQVSNLLKTFADTGMTVGDVGALLAIVFGSMVVLMGSIALLGPAMTAGLIPFAAVVVGISAILTVMALTIPVILDAVASFINKTAPAVVTILTTLGLLLDKIINSLGEVLPPIIREVGNVFSTIFNGVSKVIKTVGDVIVKIMNTAKNLVNSVLNSILSFINRLGPAVNRFISNLISGVTKLINFVVSGVEYLVNRVVDGINGLKDVLNNIPGVNIGYSGYINIPRFTPRLATGGIINYPNKGVPIGGAIAGESGAEGVIPLTDSQAMETLGQAIGRYITINANITNTMNGRTISRELQKIQASNDFAYNT